MTTPLPPVARKVPVRIEQLGRVRVDDYAWMKDENWQAVMRDPNALRADIRAHLEAENAYCDAMLASTRSLQTTLFEEMKGRIKEDDSSVPAPDGPFEYYTRYQMGAQHPVWARRPRGDATAPEEMLLDADALAKGRPYYDIGAAGASPDHALFAWSEDDQGSEYYVVKVKDLTTGETLATEIGSCAGEFVFSPCSRWIFWVWKDENGRPSKIFRRPSRGGDDVLVYEEKDAGMFLGVGRTASDRWIVVGVGNQETSESWLIPAVDPTAEPRLFAPREVGVRYDVEHWNNRFVVRTNAGGAVDFRIDWADEADTSRAAWRPFIPHRPGVLIQGLAAFQDWLVRIERVDANNRIVVTRRSDFSEHEIAFPEVAYALDLIGWDEWVTDVVRFVYQSPTTPRQWFDYDMAERKRVLRKTQEVPSGHDPGRYEALRLHALAPDGETVPITVLKLRSTPVDGSAPVLLYGYGSYGFALDAGFQTNRLSLVDRGWIWAIAHVRGGSDKGWGWFLDGRKSRKPNTFADFVAAAEHLIANGYGARSRVVAYGGSAGGLLVGAAANLRPALWGGVIGAVPFVDVLNTMSDDTLPLTPPEWPEWGNPLEDPDAYDAIAGYSPYDRVANVAYPPVLASGGLSDPRVTYWEPAKWIARLRQKSTSGAPMLLHINMSAGHGGASGRFDRLKEVARDFAFAIWAVERSWET